MKKFYRPMTFALVLATAAAPIVATPLANKKAESTIDAAVVANQNVGVEVKLLNMPKTGVVGKQLKIPAGSAEAGTKITARLKDSAGRTVLNLTYDGSKTYKNGTELTESEVQQLVSNESGNVFYLYTPSKADDYVLSYTATKEGCLDTTSEGYIISVANSSATMEFASNTAFLIPEKVKSSQSVVLPNPTVTVNDAKIEGTSALTVTAKNPKDETVKLSTITIDGESHYVFTPTANVEGEYVVTYKYQDGDGYIATQKYTINVDDDYVAPKAENLTYTLASSFPTSAVLGNKLTLPMPKVVDKSANNASVDVYTRVSVAFGDKTYDVDQSDLSFTPMDKAENTSKYTITYNMYDLSTLNLSEYDGKTLAQITESLTPTLTGKYTLSSVTDSERPTVKVSKAYDVAEDGTVADEKELKDTDYLYLMPSVVRTGTAVEIPAIFASDNYSSYSGLTLKRTIKYDNHNYSIEADSTASDSDAEKTVDVDNDYVSFDHAKANQVANVTFKKEGTYQISYEATDEAGRSRTVSYKITTKPVTEKDDVAPYITLPTITRAAQVGSKVSFGAPTVVDYELDHDENPTSNSVVDGNVKTNVYAFYGTYSSSMTDADLQTAIQDGKATELVLEDGKYSVEVTEQAKASGLSIIVRAKDHAKYLGTADNVALAGKVVKVYSVDDKTAPTITANVETIQSQLATGGQAGQGQVVTIPTFTVEDDGEVSKSIIVKDANGVTLPVSTTSDGYKFTTQSAGTYLVTISATDLGGNSVFATMKFEVKDTTKPYLVTSTQLASNGYITMTLGDSLEIPEATLKKSGKVLDNGTVTVKFDDEQPGLYDFNTTTYMFTPKSTGTYTFKYVGKDADDNQASNQDTTYQIVVSESTEKPTINIDGSFDVPTYSSYTDGGTTIKLPSFGATTKNGVKSLEVKVTGPKNNNITVLSIDADGAEIAEDDTTTPIDHYEFKATDGIGLYTVTYTATDNNGLSSTETYSVKVGDTYKPTLSGETKPASTYNVGDELGIDLTAITISDKNDTDADATETAGNVAISNSTGIRLSITLTNTSTGDTVSTTSETSSKYSYTLENSGEYKLSYVATDAAGNETTVEYTFTVKAKTSSTVQTEKVWGIVLIVLSLLVLGGVIFYFVKTKDSTKSSLDSTKKKDDKNKKN